MNGLILVDLDNVLNGLRGEDALETFTRRACERRGPVAGSWSVVFALNTAAVTGYALTFEGLRDAGRALGAAAGDPQPTVEIGLALTMPQTADVLLARLAREAPEAGAAGPYHHAIVCTADVGLAESLGSVLYVRAGGTGWRETRDDGWLGREWRMAEGGRPVVRKFADGALRLARHSQPVLDHHTVCVGSGMDDWAATRSMDVEPGSDLRKLACQLDERPWLLSQVGATRKSVRGVARLSRLPSDPPPLLGSVAPDEELEVRGTAPRPTSAHEPSAASVGIGAVRFRGTGATVASRLSPTVLASSGTTHRVDFLGVVVPAALQQLKFNVPLGDATVLVRLSHRGDDLVAKVQHSSVTQPQAWWLTGATTVKSEHRSPNGSLLPKSISVTAAPVRPSAQFAAQLALVSPVRDGEELRLEHDVAAGTIGVGWTQPSCGKSRPMAVFSHSRPLRGGDKLCVTPIQLRRRLGPLARAPEALWSLPVVVPQ
ncbi:MAG: hypothetical protein H6716_24485 [Polyangiaceae bacterium]|nr:hypothetical protein [Polyangiaceae bacterium]